MACIDLRIEPIFSIASVVPFSGRWGFIAFPPPRAAPKNKWPCFDVVCFLLVFFLVEVVFLCQKFRGEGAQECQFVRSTFAFLGVPRLLVHFEDLLLQPWPSWTRSSTGNRWPRHTTWTRGSIPPTDGATITTTFVRKGTISKIARQRGTKPSLQGHRHKISLKILGGSFWG